MNRIRQHLVALAAAALAAGCSPAIAPLTTHDAVEQALESGNGLSVNGLSANGMTANGITGNGLSANGLSANGLSANGLSANGLLAASFTNWFTSNPPDYSDMVMKYVVRCAVDAGQSRTYTSPSAVLYTWPGGLGLAPVWASGQAITELEKQLMTACLAGHANKFGLHIDISVLGLDSHNAAIAYTSTELSTFNFKEGAFFGNLFDSKGIYACSDTQLGDNESSIRACALNNTTGQSAQCPQITYMGVCSQYCTKSAADPFWSSCTVSGASYRPITTRMKRTGNINMCGDKVCQVSEATGTKDRWFDCADCK